MTESGEARLETQFLAQARTALAPSPGRVEGILQRTRLAAVAGGAAMSASSGVSGPASLSGKATLSGKALFSLKAFVGACAASLAVGFAGGIVTTKVTTPHASEVIPPTPHRAVEKPAVVEEPAPGDTEQPENLKSLAPEEEASGAPTPVALKAKKKISPGGNEEAPPTLYEEMSHVRRAQKALRAGNPALALGLMMTLDEQQPGGALRIERNVTKVLSLCALGRSSEATKIAKDTLEMNAGRVYEGRLRSSCAQIEESTVGE